jgi:hypothetical protein
MSNENIETYIENETTDTATKVYSHILLVSTRQNPLIQNKGKTKQDIRDLSY